MGSPTKCDVGVRPGVVYDGETTLQGWAKIDALEAQTDRAGLGVTGGFARTATRQQRLGGCEAAENRP